MSQPKDLICIVATALSLLSGIVSASRTADAQPTYGDPAAACAANRGKYLGKLKCELAGGAVVDILTGKDAAHASASSAVVKPGTAHAWALATSALMFEYNGTRHDLLGGEVATPDAQSKEKRMLSEWWGIDGRAELLGQLEWLQSGGHRAEFDTLGNRVDEMSEQQFLAARAAYLLDPQHVQQLDVVRKYHRKLGMKTILGWDLIRYIALCRWGFLVGHLSEAEAWDRIMPAALRLQQTFSSWHDLQSNYLIGREFWSWQQTQESGAGMRAIYKRFSTTANSPWKTNSWTMPLGVETSISVH